MLIGAALFEGLLVGISLCGWIAVILKVNPRFEMKSYPDAIVKMVTPQTKEERKATPHTRITNTTLLDL